MCKRPYVAREEGGCKPAVSIWPEQESPPFASKAGNVERAGYFTAVVDAIGVSRGRIGNIEDCDVSIQIRHESTRLAASGRIAKKAHYVSTIVDTCYFRAGDLEIGSLAIAVPYKPNYGVLVDADSCDVPAIVNTGNPRSSVLDIEEGETPIPIP